MTTPLGVPVEPERGIDNISRLCGFLRQGDGKRFGFYLLLPAEGQYIICLAKIIVLEN